MSRLFVVILASMVLAGSTHATSFLRTTEHSKLVLADSDNDGVPEEKTSYTYVQEIQQWLETEYSEFETSTHTWTVVTSKTVQVDSVNNLVQVIEYSDGNPQYTACEIYERDSLGRVVKKYSAYSPGPCEAGNASDVSVTTYVGDTDQIDSVATYYSNPNGVFDWSKPDEIVNYSYSISGKVAQKVTTDAGGYQTYVRYSYDSNDNLFSEETTYSNNVSNQYVTNFTYDNNDDLVESVSVVLENGNLSYYVGYLRLSYDPVLLTVKTE